MEWWNILPPQIWSSVAYTIDVSVTFAVVMMILKFLLVDRKEGKDKQ